MKTQYLLTIGSALLAAPFSNAAWELVTDFEDIDATSIPRWVLVDDDPSVNIFIDAFEEGSENRAMFMDAGFHGIRSNTWHAAILLPREIPWGSKATMKFDFIKFGPGVSHHVGLSNTTFATDENGIIIQPEVPSYNDFEAQISLLNPLQVRDGSSWPVIEADVFEVPVNEWVTFYIVVDANIENKTYEVYARTESMGLKKITFSAEVEGILTEMDTYRWRFGRDETLKSLFFATSNCFSISQDCSDIYLIDNVYVDYSGENLDETSTQTWAGYPLVDGYADTGNFLGWVAPVGDFVYVFSLESYIYLPESIVTASGSWSYMFR